MRESLSILSADLPRNFERYLNGGPRSESRSFVARQQPIIAKAENLDLSFQKRREKHHYSIATSMTSSLSSKKFSSSRKIWRDYFLPNQRKNRHVRIKEKRKEKKREKNRNRFIGISFFDPPSVSFLYFTLESTESRARNIRSPITRHRKPASPHQFAETNE